MKKSTRISFLLSACALSAALLANGAQAAGPTGTAADYGSAVADSAATEAIEVTQGTKYVNVNNGDTVHFVSNGKSFTWHFETFPSTTSIDLSAIAPKDLHVSGVRVYIGANPLFQG